MDTSLIKIEATKENRELIYNRCCDKYDYLIAVACGAVGGLIDVFLVGAPGDSKLQTWTDAQVDKVVIHFAKLCGWKPKGKGTIANAIEWLGNHFGVNYDQSVGKAAQDVLGITPSNHHYKSLAHSPDIVGLFFSILNQFTSTSTFLSDGQLITMDTETFELKGNNFIAKIFCGFVNWLGHLMSDVAGHQGSRNNGNRGTGIVMPFYELFNLCSFGDFDLGNGKSGTLSDVAMKAFERGYDARFALTMAIPVVIVDLLIKLCWTLRQYFQFKKPLRYCIPSKKHNDLRLMLIVGNCTLCVFDGVDALIRCDGNLVLFLMRLNLVAWFKLIKSVIFELLRKLKINADIDIIIETMQEIDLEVKVYLAELEKFDFDLYEKETKSYAEFSEKLMLSQNEEQFNQCILAIYKQAQLSLPWSGDFDKFMQNKNNGLVFE